ncbi:MAG: CoA-transferase [Chloroflexi bacterium]|nr:CoA-transferase [Chloroflexota bacterium]
MVAAAAREIRDGEVVFCGMRLPLIAFALAKEVHAPNAIGLFECGLVRDTPSPELLYTMGDPPNITNAQWATRMINIMGLLQQGCVDLGFIGGAELDRFGNLNTSYIGDWSLVRSERRSEAESRSDGTPFQFPRFLGTPDYKPFTKLPGSGGAADIASLSQRLVVIMAHEKRRLVERVSYVTSAGYGEGNGWRQRVGLPRGGPSAVITTLCVLGFDPATGEAVLRSYHPGQTIESVRSETGWDLNVAADAHETKPPTEKELAIIRRYDPQGFWTR